MTNTNAKKEEFNEQLQGGFYSCPKCIKKYKSQGTIFSHTINGCDDPEW